MPAEVETGVFARETPWHRIGVVVPDAMTAAEAIQLGGLNWTVEKQPIYRQVHVANTDGIGDKMVQVPNRFALVRDIDDKTLSVVSDIYKPFQNRDAFTFMDNLVDSGDAKYETALSLRGGAVVALTMHVPMDILVAGEDMHQAYLLLRTTHDGSGRISVYVVMIRVVCMNTLTWAIQGARHSWGVTHTADVTGKIKEARDALGMTFKYADKFKIEAEKLLGVPLDEARGIQLLETILPSRAKRDEEIDAIVENWRTSENIANFRNTGWGFLNAYTEYEQHIKNNRSGQAAFARTIDGPQAKARTELRSLILAHA